MTSRHSVFRKLTSKVSLGALLSNIVLSSVVAALPVMTEQTFAAGSVTAATGGSAILSSTAGGTFTALTGPSITGIDDNDMSASGTITLVAPTGFEFDTGGTAPTLLVTCTSSCGGGANNNVNNLPSGSTIAVTASGER